MGLPIPLGPVSQTLDPQFTINGCAKFRPASRDHLINGYTMKAPVERGGTYLYKGALCCCSQSKLQCLCRYTAYSPTFRGRHVDSRGIGHQQ